MSTVTTRQEHLDWCKKRALEYVDVGDVSQAFASFVSDVRKHPETERVLETISQLGVPLMSMGLLSTPQQMREHIEGYI